MKIADERLKRKITTVSSVLCLALLFLAVSFCGNYAPVVSAEEPGVGMNQTILTWVYDSTTSQTITWLMSEEATAQLQYIQDELNDNFESAVTIQVPGTAFASNIYRYQADLSGLLPDTTYVYRFGSEGAWSESLSFTTAAATENFNFLYLGDVQEGYAEWGNMLDAINENYPDIKFSLLGGDLTDLGYDANDWGQFMEAAGKMFSEIPLLPTLGNHDGSMYLNFFALPVNGPTDLQKEFYSFDYGNAHFVVLNSNNNTNAAAKQWLQEDLQNTEKKWKFALFHHPAYPAFDDNKTIDDSIRENWVPILEQNQVDIVFVGHQHEYMRTHPIYQGEVQTDPAAYGIVYVMGNAGSKTYGGGADFPYIAMEQTGSSYQVISIDGDVMTMTARKANGDLIESYTINKGTSTPAYKTIPHANTAYSIGVDDDGISTMTVNPGSLGFKNFAVDIESINPHSGSETVVFSRFSNDVQIELNAIKADFDEVSTAQAGFNTQAGDLIKVFVIDDLSNSIGYNPIILQ